MLRVSLHNQNPNNTSSYITVDITITSDSFLFYRYCFYCLNYTKITSEVIEVPQSKFSFKVDFPLSISSFAFTKYLLCCMNQIFNV